MPHFISSALTGRMHSSKVKIMKKNNLWILWELLSPLSFD